jgi:hypothetical protein
MRVVVEATLDVEPLLDPVDVEVVAVKEAMHHFCWFVLSCSPRRRRGEYVELFEKFEGKMLKQS